MFTVRTQTEGSFELDDSDEPAWRDGDRDLTVARVMDAGAVTGESNYTTCSGREG